MDERRKGHNMIIDCTSDLHGYLPNLRGGDILIVAGDLTSRDFEQEYQTFFDWLEQAPYEHKVFTGGNHDKLLYENVMCGIMQKTQEELDAKNIHFLHDRAMVIHGLRFYGTAWNLKFKGENTNCMAFGVNTEDEAGLLWEHIPEDIDVLVTHECAYGALDCVLDRDTFKLRHAGSKSLQRRIKYIMNERDPYHAMLHVFGHIHEDSGVGLDCLYSDLKRGGVKRCNASYVDEDYKPTNQVYRFHYKDGDFWCEE